jgi:hypothetical protein
MKLHIFIINLLFFVSQNLFAQDKTNREVEIVFKAKSTKLNAKQKKIINCFLNENPHDSSFKYMIYVPYGLTDINFNRFNNILKVFLEHKINRDEMKFTGWCFGQTNTILITTNKIDNSPPNNISPFPNLKK